MVLKTACPHAGSFVPDGCINLGSVVSGMPSISSYPSYYYCLPEHESEAREEMERITIEQRKRSDSYYSQPWV